MKKQKVETNICILWVVVGRRADNDARGPYRSAPSKIPWSKERISVNILRFYCKIGTKLIMTTRRWDFRSQWELTIQSIKVDIFNLTTSLVPSQRMRKTKYTKGEIRSTLFYFTTLILYLDCTVTEVKKIRKLLKS